MIQKIPDPEPKPRPAEAAGQAEAVDAPEEGTTAEERGLAAALSEAERDGDEHEEHRHGGHVHTAFRRGSEAGREQ